MFMQSDGSAMHVHAFPMHETRHSQWDSRNVTLVCGPPGSGKSTLAAQLHGNVLELENIVAADYRKRLKMYGRAAYRIGRLMVADHAVVRGAPGFVERHHHEDLCRPSRTIVMLTPADVCHERVHERNRDGVDGEHGAIDHWWSVWDAEHSPIDNPWGF